FQAEDGIRDFHVTGVQTCALPILRRAAGDSGTSASAAAGARRTATASAAPAGSGTAARTSHRGGAVRADDARGAQRAAAAGERALRVRSFGSLRRGPRDPPEERAVAAAVDLDADHPRWPRRPARYERVQPRARRPARR